MDRCFAKERQRKNEWRVCFWLWCIHAFIKSRVTVVCKLVRIADKGQTHGSLLLIVSNREVILFTIEHSENNPARPNRRTTRHSTFRGLSMIFHHGCLAFYNQAKERGKDHFLLVGVEYSLSLSRTNHRALLSFCFGSRGTTEAKALSSCRKTR